MNIQNALEKIAQAERLLAEAKSILFSHSSAPQTVQTEEILTPSTTEETETPPQQDAEFDINTINGIVGQLLAIASSHPSDEEALPVLEKITHATIDSKALASLMRFNWTRLKGQVHDYLQSPNDPMSFVIVREQDRTTGNIQEKKLFLEAKSRNPVPVTLRKDIGEEHWRIFTFSL